MFLQHHHCQSQLVYACASVNISYSFPSFWHLLTLVLHFRFNCLNMTRTFFVVCHGREAKMFWAGNKTGFACLSVPKVFFSEIKPFPLHRCTATTAILPCFFSLLKKFFSNFLFNLGFLLPNLVPPFCEKN